MSYTPGRTDGRENQSQIERGGGATTTTHNTHIYEENTQKGKFLIQEKRKKGKKKCPKEVDIFGEGGTGAGAAATRNK